jgi:hypothetical protein
MTRRLPQEYLDWVAQHTSQIQAKPALFQSEKLLPLWTFFKQSESNLLNADNSALQKELEGGDSEFGLALYAMNHLLHIESMQVFRSLGMPPSSITPATWEISSDSFVAKASLGSGWLGKDGTLYADIPFGQLDPNWAIAAVCYALKELGLIKAHLFNTPGTVINHFQSQGQLTIAIIGDWGTGKWRDHNYKDPASLVAEAISTLSPQPDITIHLGDVYYSGLIHEEKRNLIPGFPKGASGYNFTMNSNHEAYDGSEGFYKVALANDLFKYQSQKSYFAINFKNWVIVALDSAFYDKSLMVMKGAITDGTNTYQQDFVKSLNISPDQQIVLLTHHNGLNYDGTVINDPLVSQVYTALGNIYPDYWYYGHTHNGFVYNDKSAIGAVQYQTRFKTYPRLRCVGHASIPYGKASIESSNKGLDYYVQTPVPDPHDSQKLRVLNGFAMLTLSQQNLQEQFYEVSPTTGLRPAWPL